MHDQPQPPKTPFVVGYDAGYNHGRTHGALIAFGVGILSASLWVIAQVAL